MKKIAVRRADEKTKRALKLKMIFLAYRKTAETEAILKRLKAEDENAESARIRCPHCRWQPNKTSRWFCGDCGAPEYFYDGCGASWNTFETGGVCPGCAHKWIWTSCLRCTEWARHEDWYEKKID